MSAQEPISVEDVSVYELTPDDVKREARRFGLDVSSGKRSRAEQDALIKQWEASGRKGVKPAVNSLHLSGGALDISGDRDKQRQFYEHMKQNYGANLPELIDEIASKNHVHVGFKRGGARTALEPIPLDDIVELADVAPVEPAAPSPAEQPVARPLSLGQPASLGATNGSSESSVNPEITVETPSSAQSYLRSPGRPPGISSAGMDRFTASAAGKNTPGKKPKVWKVPKKYQEGIPQEMLYGGVQFTPLPNIDKIVSTGDWQNPEGGKLPGYASTIVKYSTALSRGLIPFSDEKEFFHLVESAANDALFGLQGMGGAEALPETYARWQANPSLVRSMTEAQTNELKKAYEQWEAGGGTDEIPLSAYGHALAGVVPIFGPQAAEGVRQWKAGDKASATGTFTAIGLGAFLPALFKRMKGARVERLAAEGKPAAFEPLPKPGGPLKAETQASGPAINIPATEVPPELTARGVKGVRVEPHGNETITSTDRATDVVIVNKDAIDRAMTEDPTGAKLAAQLDEGLRHEPGHIDTPENRRRALDWLWDEYAANRISDTAYVEIYGNIEEGRWFTDKHSRLEERFVNETTQTGRPEGTPEPRSDVEGAAVEQPGFEPLPAVKAELALEPRGEFNEGFDAGLRGSQTTVSGDAWEKLWHFKYAENVKLPPAISKAVSDLAEVVAERGSRLDVSRRYVLDDALATLSPDPARDTAPHSPANKLARLMKQTSDVLLDPTHQSRLSNALTAYKQALGEAVGRKALPGGTVLEPKLETATRYDYEGARGKLNASISDLATLIKPYTHLGYITEQAFRDFANSYVTGSLAERDALSSANWMESILKGSPFSEGALLKLPPDKISQAKDALLEFRESLDAYKSAYDLARAEISGATSGQQPGFEPVPSLKAEPALEPIPVEDVTPVTDTPATKALYEGPLQPSSSKGRGTGGSHLDMIQYIRTKLKGIDMGHLTGEQRHLRESRLRQPGVFSKDGMPWDDAEIELRQMGYLQEGESLLDALDRATREKIYTPQKLEEIAFDELSDFFDEAAKEAPAKKKTSTPKGFEPLPDSASVRETPPRSTVEQPESGQIRERSFPKTLENAWLEKGSDLTYESITNRETAANAERIINRIGDDEAVKFVTDAAEHEFSADHTAVGIGLIRKFQEVGDYARAGDVASELSARLTLQGQAIQAAKLAVNHSPEQAVLTGQKILSKVKPGQRLTALQVEELTATARQLQEATAEVGRLREIIEKKRAQKLSEGPTAKVSSSYRARLENEAQAAWGRIQERLKTERGSGGPSKEVLADYARWGAAKLAVKGIDLATWTEQMVKDLGEQIRPYLTEIRKQAYELYKTERRADAAAQAGKPRTKSAAAEIGAEQRAEASAAKQAERQAARELKTEQRAYEQAQKRAEELAQKLGKHYASLDPVGRIKRGVIDALNTPRTLLASVDISAPGRQGMWFYVNHPIESTRAFREQISALFKSKQDFIAYENRMKADPYYDMAKDSGVPFTHTHSEIGNVPGIHEEPFQSKAGALWGVRHSEQAYSTFLNSQRLRVFKDGAKLLESQGKTFETVPHEFKALADYISSGTGRGNLGKFNAMGAQMSNVLFAPRWVASRFKLLNPFYYRKLYSQSPTVGRMAIKDAARFASFWMGTLTLAKLTGAADVDLDPASPDFLKARVGKAHFDVSGGFQSEIRLLVQFGAAVEARLSGEKQKKTPLAILGDFTRRKLAPVPGFAVDFLTGERLKRDPATGKPMKFDPVAGSADMVIPLIFQDLWDAYTVERASGSGRVESLKGPLMTLPSAVGISTQYYKPKDPVSPAAQTAFDRLAATQPRAVLPPDEQKRADLRTDLAKKIKEGANADDLIKQHEAELSPGDKRTLKEAKERNSVETAAYLLLRNNDMEGFKSVWDKADETEKSLLRKTLKRKQSELAGDGRVGFQAKMRLTKDERRKLIEQIKEMLQVKPYPLPLEFSPLP